MPSSSTTQQQSERNAVRNCRRVTTAAAAAAAARMNTNPQQLNNMIHVPASGRWLSSFFGGGGGKGSGGGSGFSLNPLYHWNNHRDRKDGEKIKENLAKMAETDTWPVREMLRELNEGLNGLGATIGGRTKEVIETKKRRAALRGIVDVMGDAADADALAAMTREEKLRAAVAAETTVEDINGVIEVFQSITLMQRVVRNQRLAGKPIPETADAMQLLMQLEGKRALSKKQKKNIVKHHSHKMKSIMGRKNRGF